MADDRAYVDWWYRYVLLSEALGSAVASTRKFMDTDVRPILPSVHVPAMMLYRPDAHPSDSGRTEAAHYLARHIPGARLKELPGTDGALWIGDQAPLHHAIDSFLADVASERSELDRSGGTHTGECETIDNKLGGVAVNIGA